ncbi:TetR/AcrR family transcriptional regulator [Paenibacillus sp. DCT19]|uniref:TetR/AcrR family transcriptional regulator n=1 Tax=Paenibacillus sp. DCT19 TaxID=2211212 RepID=UPI0013E31F44|nr:TetR/AcrR family transcriptional regulator [Paenibacillus sp. DCT19]
MTLDRIKEASLLLFSKHGFEGTSLHEIATQVGIKKPSLYTYFSSKDELYLDLLNDALQTELGYARQLLERRHGHEGSLQEVLLRYLSHYMERYEQESSVAFIIRTCLYPPQHLRAQIHERRTYYMQSLDQLLFTLFENERSGSLPVPSSAVEISIAFFRVYLQGLWVELLRSGREYAYARLQTTWPAVSNTL